MAGLPMAGRLAKPRGAMEARNTLSPETYFDFLCVCLDLLGGGCGCTQSLEEGVMESGTEVTGNGCEYSSASTGNELGSSLRAAVRLTTDHLSSPRIVLLATIFGVIYVYCRKCTLGNKYQTANERLPFPPLGEVTLEQHSNLPVCHAGFPGFSW